MNEVQKKRLEYLKKKQREIRHERALLHEKMFIMESIPDFEKNYVFANAEQICSINTFLCTLPAMTPTRPDFRNLEKQEMPYENMKHETNQVFVCFLHGMHIVFDLFAMGELHQVCKDIVYWQDFCPDLILVWHNFADFIYINDDKTPIKSRL